jgi:hypothetical protein
MQGCLGCGWCWGGGVVAGCAVPLDRWALRMESCLLERAGQGGMDMDDGRLDS